MRFYLAILPVLFLLFFVGLFDKNKEPTSLLVKLFGLGILSAIVTLIVSEIVSLFLSLFGIDFGSGVFAVFFNAFIYVACIEEGSKWIMTYFLSYSHKEFDEMYDMIVYAVYVSLGFACLENILYVFVAENFIGTSVLRALFSVPGHACFGVLMGYFLSLAKEAQKVGNNKKKNLYKVLSYIVPVLCHGFYDFCVMLSVAAPWLIIVWLIFVIILFIISIIKIVGTAKKCQKELYIENVSNINYCMNCGIKLVGNYCTNCGRKCR